MICCKSGEHFFSKIKRGVRSKAVPCTSRTCVLNAGGLKGARTAAFGIFALALCGAFQAFAVTVTRTSGAVMQTDFPNGLYCSYASYVISNNTATAYSNIWVKADAFTGGVVSLGGGDNGLYHIDDLASGAHKTAFFYVCATSVTTLPQSHTVSVYEGYPDSGDLLANPVFSLTVDDASANNSSKVYAVTYEPAQPTVGGTVQVTVVGDAGNVRKLDVVNFTPAAFTNWNAAAFELVDVALALTNKNGQARLISDYLELPLEYSTWAGGNITYTAHYTFRALIETAQNTPVSPITYATQGNASSHTTTTGYGSFAPIQSPTNTTVLAKLADVTQVYTNETVAYTVRFTNSGPNDMALDRIADTLPPCMSYVPGSSLFHGQSVLDPAISGTLLIWSETDLIPANSSRDLVFQARASIAGYSTNRVVAYVGGESTLIDTTLRTDDTVPGEVTVRTLLPPTAADDSFSVAEDGILTVPAPGVLANDSDLNGFPITVIAHTQPGNGDLAINADGSFTYTPAPDTFGGDSFTYTITNYNGRAATAVVNLTVLPVNDAPGFTVGADQTVLMNAGAQAVASWATGISKGPANESGQALTFAVTNDNTVLFSAQPAVSADGMLTYTPAPGLSGVATVTLYLQDDGGTDNGGADSSPAQTFTITVIAYSIGNWVFMDMNNDGIRDFGDDGIAGVSLSLFAASGGQPVGSALQTTVTDTNGFYRFDHLAAGSYVAVVDMLESLSLDGFESSTGWVDTLTLAGDLLDHGMDEPMSAGVIFYGICSVPVAVGPGLQPTGELASIHTGAGQTGPCGDACDNLVVDFGFTPVYSIGNRVFFDDDFDMYQDNGEAGVPGVPLFAFAAGADGLPMGEPLAYAVTDANGWYRLDGLVKGTYVVVLDRQAAVAANGDLAPYTSTIGATNDMTLAGDRWDHGWYHPLTTLGPVTNGYATGSVELGPAMQPLGEQTNGVAGVGANSPYGDDRDNLVLDFGLVRTFCIGNRVFLDDGSGGGTADNGIQDGSEPGISNVAMRIFAADANGEPTGDALVIGTDNLTAALTDANGWYRFFRLAPGDYVVVADVGLSTNLTGFAFRDGSTWVDPTATSTSLVGLASSTGYNSDLTLGGDSRDHGKDTPVSLGVVSYGIAGPKLTLGVGLQPMGEATNALTGAASHAPSGDAFDNLVMDFGFAPTYSIGNRVFWDNGAGAGTDNNGVQDGEEPGIAGAVVELRTNGVTLAATVTDSSGYYRFDNLLAGSYTLYLPPRNFSGAGVLAGMFSAAGTVSGDTGDKGIDEADPVADGIESGTVTVGLGVQPAGESDIGTGAGGNSAFGDAYDDLTVDFGLIEANAYNCKVGSLVWHDADNNGVYDAGESGIAGVTVEVWAVDTNGDLAGGTPVSVTNTAADGTYMFNGLEPGMYRVRIPSSVFGSGQPLALTNTASTLRSEADDQTDNDNNGAQSASGQAALSPVFQLSRGGEPVDGAGVPDEFGPGAGQDNAPLTDSNGDMTVDFGFYAPSLDQANLGSLGSLVWSDLDNDGAWDSGEPGIPGVVLELYMTHAAGLVYWGSATSALDGTYLFSDLMDGTNWVVRIPASNFAPEGALFGFPMSGGAPVNADNQTDDDNNALQPGGLGAEVWSPAISLVTGTAPTNSASGEFGTGYAQDSTGVYIDANGDMTVDFGFTPAYSIGNRVFADLDNDGVMDAGESGIPGVPMVLFAADAGGDPAGSVLAGTVTDSEGWYRFDDLLAGAYVVVADVANAPALAYWAGSSGVSSDVTLNGDGKDHGRDSPVSIGSVVGGIASVAVTVGPGAQPEGEGTGEGAGANSPYGDDRDTLTVDFGFTPTYSLGNWVFKDSDNSGDSAIETLDTYGISNVTVRLFTADGSGMPTGQTVSVMTTCTNGFYRFDGLLPGTYVAVVDASGSPALEHFRSSTGMTGESGLGADLHDSGLDTPLGSGSVLPGGIVSRPVTLGYGLQPEGESEGPCLGLYGPLGDSFDNLTVDFGFYPLYSLGNRVFLDNGAGGGTLNNGTQDGDEPGAAGVSVMLFPADDSGSPTGSVHAATVTDASGWYRFDDLEAGSYVVVLDVANSASLAGTVSSSGVSADTTVSGDVKDHGYDTPVSVGTVINGIAGVPVSLGVDAIIQPSGEAVSEGAGANGTNGDPADNLTLDFGFTAVASVSGNVFEDINGNGSFDAADTGGIEGVTVKLESGGGAVLATTVTDGNGAFAFAGLPPGDYLIEVVDLPGWVSTGDSDGEGDRQVAISLASGQNAAGINFLETRPGLIGGHVWNDLNADGVFDAEEMMIGLGGVTVSLETNGVTVAETTTMTGGQFLFENVLPGDYTVVQTDLPGWLSTADTDGANDNRIALSLSSAGSSTGNNFLDYTYAVISGSVRVDVNGNGLADVEDADGVPGVTVRLLDAGEQEVGTTVTAVDGSFIFANVAPGSYTVVEIDPAGYVSTGANQINVAAASGQQLGGYVFLDTQTGNIGDRVWEDLNGNGLQDAGEAGLSNVVVRLLDAEGTEVASTQTDTNGVFLFSAQLPGAYVLDVSAPEDFEPTRYHVGDDRTLDNDINPLTGLSDLILLTAGQTNLSADAGFVLPALVNGYVFVDNDADLLRDTGDSSITNILVRLVSDGWVVASTNTDAFGYYEFGSVMPGVVSVLVSRADAVLLAVPESEDERRNRAVPDVEGVDAVIVRTVLSGEGVLEERPTETLNFGFADYPLSTAIDISLHATAEGVVIQLWTVNEAGNGDIVIYAWIENDWTEVGRVPGWRVEGEGANSYTVAAGGLAAGGAYYLKVIDEAGTVHLSPAPVAVHALRVAAVRLDLQSVSLRFNTDPGRLYQVEVSTDLGVWRTEYVSAPTAAGWTPYDTAPFMAGPGGQTEVRVPRNSRSRAFFRIRRVE